MDEEQCRTHFQETFRQIDSFRLMYPSTWNDLIGNFINKWVVCMEVFPKIHTFTSLSLLEKLCEHVDTIWAAVENVPDPSA